MYSQQQLKSLCQAQTCQNPAKTQMNLINSWKATKEAAKAERGIKNGNTPDFMFKMFAQDQQLIKTNCSEFSFKNSQQRYASKGALKSYNRSIQKYYSSQCQIQSPTKNTKPTHYKFKLTKKFSCNSGAESFSEKKQKKVPRLNKMNSLQEKPRRNQNTIRIGNRQILILKLLGQGKFGKVFLVIQTKVGFVMAMKVIEKKRVNSEKILQQLISQIKIQNFLCHPNVIIGYGYHQDKDRIYSLMELGSDGQLYSFMEKSLMNQQSTSYIIKQVLRAVQHLHQNNIIHRDLKPENIVVTHGSIKICDFGWAVHLKKQLRSTYCGTPLYFSPQMLTGKEYDQKIDIWAIGVMAFELFTGGSPFGITRQNHLYKIVTDQVNFNQNGSIKYSYSFKKFVRSILKRNPDQRLSCNQLLQSAFIKNYEQLETCEQLCMPKPDKSKIL